VLALVIGTLVVYGRVCAHEFAGFDDSMTIHHNPRYAPPTAAKIAKTWEETVDGLYAPITYSYWGALAYWAELKDVDPAGVHLDARVYHTGSLVLHLLSVLVVFAILRLLCENIWAALVGAMLYGWHPVQVESVAWASGAKDLLCGLLSLCAVYQYVLFAKKRVQGLGFRVQDEVGRKVGRAWPHYVCGGVALVLAMLSKPSAMVVPVVVGALDLWVVRRGWRNVLAASGGWMLLISPLVVVARVAQTTHGLFPVAMWRRPGIAADAVVFYLWKLVWPVTLTPDYGRRPEIVLKMWGGVWVWVALAVLAGAAVWAWRGRVARPWVAAGALVFVASLGPVLGLTPFMFQYTSGVADHYLYLAMFGPALLATWAVVRYGRRFGAVGCALGLGVLGVRSYQQLGWWHDDRTIWEHTMACCPDSFIAPTNLATAYGREANALRVAGEDAREAGRIEEANWMMARQHEQYVKAADLLEWALAVNPKSMAALHNAFMYNFRLGRYQRAVERLERLLAINDKLPESERTNFTALHDAAGNLWMKLGRFDKAAAEYERVLAATPENKDAAAELKEARTRSAEARVDEGDAVKR
jgi:hypothetical protein